MPSKTSALFKGALILAATASLAACASKKTTPPGPAPVAPSQPTPQPARPNTPPPVAQRPTGPIPGSVEDFVVSAGDRVYFDTDQHTLRDDARGVLDKQATWLARYPQVTVRIEGNADERGTREYNLALGARRADSVREYLVGRGVAAGRVSTISYGKERPIDAGTGEEAWGKNRNAHTALVSGAVQ
jgi:peptidoglycan-associated lipoprotein